MLVVRVTLSLLCLGGPGPKSQYSQQFFSSQKYSDLLWGPHSLLLSRYQGSGGKGAGLWSWSLMFIWCSV